MSSWCSVQATSESEKARIVAADLLRVGIGSQCEIFSATVTRVTRDVIRGVCVISPEGRHQAHVTFDFLDPNDGITIELLHTDDETDVSVSGTIRGIPSGPKDFGKIANAESEAPTIGHPMGDYILRVLFGTSIFWFWMLIFLFMSWKAMTGDVIERMGIEFGLGMIGFCFLMTAYGFVSVRHNRRRYPAALQTKNF